MSMYEEEEDSNIFSRCLSNIEKRVYEDSLIERSKKDVRERFDGHIKLFRKLVSLKNENTDYREATNNVLSKILFSDSRENSILADGYSSEHALGMIDGVNIFCFPEKYLEILEKRCAEQLRMLGEDGYGDE